MAELAPQPLSFAEHAPFIAEGSATVTGTAAEVWAVLVDHRAWPRWFAAVKSCEPTSDPAEGIGSTRTVGLGGGLVITEEFIAWDEPRLWAFTGTSGPPLATSLVERVVIGQTEAGRTEVTYRMAVQPRTGLGWFLRMIRPKVAQNLNTALRSLDAELQARRDGAEGPATSA